jgi:flagellar protein FlaG
MSKTVGSLNAIEPVAAMIARPVAPVTEVPPKPAVQPKAQAADLRLVIEEDEATGNYIYKTLDRRTGEVVQQLPRDAVLKLRSSDSYEPGHVVDTWD